MAHQRAKLRETLTWRKQNNRSRLMLKRVLEIRFVFVDSYKREVTSVNGWLRKKGKRSWRHRMRMWKTTCAFLNKYTSPCFFSLRHFSNLRRNSIKTDTELPLLTILSFFFRKFGSWPKKKNAGLQLVSCLHQAQAEGLFSLETFQYFLQ